MTSANDATILAALSRFPDMPAHEADEFIAKIERPENVPVCHAVLGRIGEDALAGDARRTFREFQRWAQDRTRRTRNEEWTARRRRQETRTALNMARLHARGNVSDETLLLYGISGPLPERAAYSAMSIEEKQRVWAERLEARFGPGWRQRFSDRGLRLPTFRPEPAFIDWRRDGF